MANCLLESKNYKWFHFVIFVRAIFTDRKTIKFNWALYVAQAQGRGRRGHKNKVVIDVNKKKTSSRVVKKGKKSQLGDKFMAFTNDIEEILKMLMQMLMYSKF